MTLTKRSFIISKKLYALKPETFTVTSSPVNYPDGTSRESYRITVEAAWFSKRRNGNIAAFTGHLWGFSSKKISYEEFLLTWDGRYGGEPDGCWDGDGTWWNANYAGDLNLQRQLLPFLQTMLTNYPAAPTGYDGWYINQ